MTLFESVTARLMDHLDAGVFPWRKAWLTGTPICARRTPEELAWLRKRMRRVESEAMAPFAEVRFDLGEGETPPWSGGYSFGQGNDGDTIADHVLARMPSKPWIVYDPNRDPGYYVPEDLVSIPPRAHFETTADYFATLFHELVHTTGHPKRLNRFGRVNHYLVRRHATEELVAEFGSAFLCAITRTWNSAVEARQAAYIQGWVGSLRGDPPRLARVLADAQRAAEFILGKIPIAAGHPDRN
ncbi:MAG: zincin-like metallopeptidase domain-containing protein [Limisphaerales bacterium]